jgi:hypothetical protein
MPKLKEIGLLVENINARDYVPQAQAAERLGFNSFWVPLGEGSNITRYRIAACLRFLLKVKEHTVRWHGEQEHSPASSRGTRYLFRRTSEAL